MSFGAFIVAMTIGAALLALWAGVRFPRMGPNTLAGAVQPFMPRKPVSMTIV